MARQVCKCPDGRSPGVQVPRPPAGCASAPTDAGRYPEACCQPRRLLLTRMARRVCKYPDGRLPGVHVHQQTAE